MLAGTQGMAREYLYPAFWEFFSFAVSELYQELPAANRSREFI